MVRLNAQKMPLRMRRSSTRGSRQHGSCDWSLLPKQLSLRSFVLRTGYALRLLPVTPTVADGAWLLTGDPIRGLAVLVVAPPCPLILAAPGAIIAGFAIPPRGSCFYRALQGSMG